MVKSTEVSNPILIQGGMGVAVSSWKLARAVSKAGQLGVVSGTAIDTVLVRRLQLGDVGGHVRRAFAEFPYPEMAEQILDRYFVEGGKADDESLATTMILSHEPTAEEVQRVVVANFVEVLFGKRRPRRIGGNQLSRKDPDADAAIVVRCDACGC